MPLQVVAGDAAVGAINGLMRKHPHIARHIRTLVSSSFATRGGARRSQRRIAHLRRGLR